MSALRLRNVTKSYGANVALAGLSFEVPSGGVCGLVGPNGAGKTTTMGIVAGLIRPDAGDVDVLGAGPFSHATHAGRVSILPQDCELDPHLSIVSLLTWLGRLQGMAPPDASREAVSALERVGLNERRNSRIRELSHGMRRRVTLAQALIGSPELVILDEPTSGLDPELVVRMRELFREQGARSTLIISSHVLSELEAVCDSVVFLEAGRCVWSGALDEVTGAGARVQILFAEAVSPIRLPVEVTCDWQPQSLAISIPPDRSVAEVNAAVLPALLAAGMPIAEVRRGQSLEASYLEIAGRGA